MRDFPATFIQDVPGDSDEVRWAQVGGALHAVHDHLRSHVQRELKNFLQEMQKYTRNAKVY